MLTEPKKVSVLIPTYNGAKFIAEAIDSVLGQTFHDYELIIADDVSSDETRDIIRSYVKKYPSIRFIEHTKNLGCCENINSLLLAATGEYIKILIQDDVLDKKCLEVCAGILDAYPQVGVVTSYQKFIGDWNTYRKMPTIPAVGELDGKTIQRHLLIHRNWIGGETAVMFRRDALTTGLLHPRWGWVVDMDLWMRILHRYNLYVVPQVLTYPRMHQQQGTVYLNKNFSFIREELEHLDYTALFPELYPQLTSRERRQLIHAKIERVLEEEFSHKQYRALWQLRTVGVQYAGWYFYLLLSHFLWRKGKVFLSHLPILQTIAAGRAARGSETRDHWWRQQYSFVSHKKEIKTGHGHVHTIGSISYPLDRLRSTIVTDVGTDNVPLSQTVHYAWIADLVAGRDDRETRARYQSYIRRYFPEDDSDKSVEHVIQLVRLGRDTAGESIVIFPPVRKSHTDSDMALIYDGNHRAALALALGKKEIPVLIINQRVSVEDLRPRIWNE